MDIFKPFYPQLLARQPLPAYYTPLCISLSILPLLTKSYRSVTSISILPLLLYLCVSWPCFTTGDPSSDYYNNSQFIALPLWYIDFVLLTPWKGKDAPAFLGTLHEDISKRDETGRAPQRWEDLATLTQRLKWAIRLMFPPAHRGVGWNWQVKGVPIHYDANLPRWQFVRRQLWSAVQYYALCVVVLAALGLSNALKMDLEPRQSVWSPVATALVGWRGATWVWARLCCSYNIAATLCVTSGLTQSWEWPPLMGPLREAWSVRQMWSVTYHQVCRRLLSRPSTRIARLLRLAKGSLVSSYTQLSLSFGISCLFHQAQMFNVTRRDMGERAFFLSQPLAIIAEDFVRWIWKKTAFSGRNPRFEIVVGYVWTFLWFSFSLRLYVDGLVQADVVKDWVLKYHPLSMGAEAGGHLLAWLRR